MCVDIRKYLYLCSRGQRLLLVWFSERKEHQIQCIRPGLHIHLTQRRTILALLPPKILSQLPKSGSVLGERE